MAERKVAKQVRFYRFKNALKEKTGGLSGEEAEISPEALAAAEQALSEMAEDYPDWVSTIIDKLAEQHQLCLADEGNRKPAFQEIRAIAHDMKGQGGTFGYPLITTFADSLSGFAAITGAYADNQVDLIKAHIDAMRAVISGRVKGDGGEIGKQLSAGLNQAIEKFNTG